MTRSKFDLCSHYQHSLYKQKRFGQFNWGQMLTSTKVLIRKRLATSNATVSTEPLSPTSLDESLHHLEAIPPILRKYSTVGQRYSLASTIGDGSIGLVCTSKHIEPIKPLRPNGSHLNVSYFSDSNHRASMEDRLLISFLNAEEPELPCDEDRHNLNHRSMTPISLFAIFDGHGGAEASQYCCDWLSSYLQYHLTFSESVSSSFKSTFHSMNVDFSSAGFTCGSTVCSCLVIEKKYIACANLGDSRAIVIQENGGVVGLSRSHRPSSPDETKRITSLGGKVIYTDRWTVEGKLAVSRSIGDYDLKPFVTSDPEITEYQIQLGDMYLVLGSNCVFDVLDNTEIAKIVLAFSTAESDLSNNLMHLAQFICDQAK